MRRSLSTSLLVTTTVADVRPRRRPRSGIEPSKPAAKAVASPTPLPNVAALTVNPVQDKRVAPARRAVHVFLWGHREEADRDLKLAKRSASPGEAALRVAQHREGPQERVRVARVDLVIDKINKTGLGIIARLDKPD